MELDRNLLFFFLCLFHVSLFLDFCPPDCRCNHEQSSVSCFGADVLPLFHRSTQEVWLVGSKLSIIPQNAFFNLTYISHIFICDDENVRFLEKHSFYNLSTVTHIQLSGIKTLTHIDHEAFKDLPKLKYLGISNTGLTSFPDLQHIHSIQQDFILEIVENIFLQVIPANSFTGISENPLTLLLNSNGVTEIQRFAFNGSGLEEVSLHGNMALRRIDEFAFHGVSEGPKLLDLSETSVGSLPSVGLENVEKLLLRNTWSLRALPPLGAFTHLQSAELTFPSHCCGLTMLHRLRRDYEELICSLNWTDVGDMPEFSSGFFGRNNQLSDNTVSDSSTAVSFSHNHHSGGFCPSEASDCFYVDLPVDHLSKGFGASLCTDGLTDQPLCMPLPDALNPCEDMMSRGFLKVLVWLVSLSAILTNLLVLFILLTSRQKISITRFLIGHLAFADLCMGMYLLLIASVDLYTRSHYHHYAIAWQTGGGCKLAGILSVFASELSVYTLTLISLQRWHAIFFTMRPDRKFRFRHAVMLMLIGWFLCTTLAMLPVVGVSSYHRVSICLPMDTETAAAQAYVVSILSANVFAFIVVCLCYLHIYFMVHNPQHLSSRCDRSMAKRMAVLIFTNFLCLVPICFYGLSAALHHPLMTLTDSKVLLVLFYPLNSCAHPFFYTILTKAFLKDVLVFLGRLGICQQRVHFHRSKYNSPH